VKSDKKKIGRPMEHPLPDNLKAWILLQLIDGVTQANVVRMATGGVEGLPEDIPRYTGERQALTMCIQRMTKGAGARIAKRKFPRGEDNSTPDANEIDITTVKGRMDALREMFVDLGNNGSVRLSALEKYVELEKEAKDAPPPAEPPGQYDDARLLEEWMRMVEFLFILKMEMEQRHCTPPPLPEILCSSAGKPDADSKPDTGNDVHVAGDDVHAENDDIAEPPPTPEPPLKSDITLTPPKSGTDTSDKADPRIDTGGWHKRRNL